MAAVIVLVFLPRFAAAHTLGLSTCDLTVAPNGEVEARFVFTSAEPLGGLRLDREGDGVDDADVAAAQGELAAFVRDGVDVTADGDPCPFAFEGAELIELDGLTLRARYACPEGAAAVGVTLYYLSRLGAGHREVARIVYAGEPPASAEAVLRGDHRALSLDLPARPVPAWRRALRVLGPAGLAAIAAGLLAIGAYLVRAWAVRRRRA